MTLGPTCNSDYFIRSNFLSQRIPIIFSPVELTHLIDSRTYDVIIIGGGLSGLSAAVDLCSRGFKILLLEQRQHLGGRTYSFVDEKTSDVVDNGQHLMMGCYKETRSYLQTVGSAHLASLQPNLHIDFIHPQKGSGSLSCPTLPAPLHLLAGLLNLSTVPFPHRLKLLNVGRELLRTSQEKERKLESMTVDEWLTSLGQSEENKKYLWDIIAIGTLNDDPKTVSALLFFRVLRAAFLGKKENSSMLIPRVGLSQLLVDPAEKFIQEHGGDVRKGVSVSGFNVQAAHILSVHCGSVGMQARVFLSAVPYYALPSLFAPETLNRETFLFGAQHLQSSPIITINLWLDREVMQEDFAAVLDSRIQWIFNKTKLLRGVEKLSSGVKRQYLSLVISGAGEYVDLEKERLADIAMEDLRRVLPASKEAKLLHSLVVKEKRATFSPKPGVEALRPSSATPFDNFFLAGDWTDTGYPATIEGAVVSGRRAARAVDQLLRTRSKVAR